MEILKGHFYMSLKENDESIFYKIESVNTDNSGMDWVKYKAVSGKSESNSLPVIYFRENFVKISENTVKILFGGIL